jgi:hypothetical protein
MMARKNRDHYVPVTLAITIEGKRYGATFNIPDTRAFKSADVQANEVLSTLVPLVIETVGRHFKGGV